MMIHEITAAKVHLVPRGNLNTVLKIQEILVDAVRWDGAAGVFVGVDERSQSASGAHDRVEVQTQLGRDRVVGPEAGRGHDPVHHDLLLGVVGAPDDLEPEKVFGAIFQYPGTYGHVRDYSAQIAALVDGGEAPAMRPRPQQARPRFAR